MLQKSDSFCNHEPNVIKYTNVIVYENKEDGA